MNNTMDAPAGYSRTRKVLLHKAKPGDEGGSVICSAQKSYHWLRVPWIPHYTRRGMFVAPGGVVMDGAALLAAGAIELPRMLWTRAYNQRR